MIPIDHDTPLSSRTTKSLREELAARQADPDQCLGNRARIATLRNELAERQGCQVVTVVVPVDATVVDTGLWCHDCALPSVVRAAVTLKADPTVRITEVHVCLDCGAHS